MINRTVNPRRKRALEIRWFLGNLQEYYANKGAASDRIVLEVRADENSGDFVGLFSGRSFLKFLNRKTI